MAFNAKAKLLNFTEKLKTASGNYRINVVTWSCLPFVSRNLYFILANFMTQVSRHSVENFRCCVTRKVVESYDFKTNYLKSRSLLKPPRCNVMLKSCRIFISCEEVELFSIECRKTKTKYRTVLLIKLKLNFSLFPQQKIIERRHLMKMPSSLSCLDFSL